MIGIINLVRGLAHLITKDSAAGAAGISINNTGGTDIIYLFAIIGGVQAVLALFYLYVTFFNRKIMPIAFMIEGLKTSVNLWIGYSFKPSQADVVVGSSQDKLQLTLTLLGFLMIGLSERQRRMERKNNHEGEKYEPSI